MSAPETISILEHQISTDSPTWTVVCGAVRAFQNRVDKIHRAIEQTLEVGMPERLRRLKTTAGSLLKLLGANLTDEGVAQLVPDDVAAVLAYGVKERLGEVSRRLEEMRKRTSSGEIVSGAAAELAALKAVLAWNKVKQVIAPAPRLTDFLRIGIAAQVLGLDDEAVARDEKFNILLAPTLFVPDLARAREHCGLRDRSVVVAFVDIDKFKDLNTTLDETTVDRDVLPMFMTRFEAFVFGHGRAYRQGGDEYLVILDNADRETAAFLLDRLRRFLGATEYGPHAVTTTVSVGACVVEPDAPYTEHQVVRAANLAKDRAKDGGRDRVEFARPEDLEKAVDET